MGIDLTKLEKVRHQGSNITARCPACAESGGDRKGEHLFVNEKGQFGCVLHPGEPGQKHRQRILELAGVKEGLNKSFEVRKPFTTRPEPFVIQKNILGTLGTHNFNPRVMHPGAANRVGNSSEQESSNEVVPSVPENETGHSCLPFFNDDDIYE